MPQRPNLLQSLWLRVGELLGVPGLPAPPALEATPPELELPEGVDPLIHTIRTSVIGDDIVLDGPFGPKRMVYADYTASGRCLSFVEDYIREQVMPLYANTHSESSGTGLQTTHLREQARAIIREAVGGTEEDMVIFCGSGCTGAIFKFIGVLDLRISETLDEAWQLSASIPQAERPVVFVGPYEHHSNEVMWRKTIATVVPIRQDATGGVDLAHLEEELQRYAERPMRLGSFSAGSNVTGRLTDTSAIARMLHSHGALACFDYAGAGPYVPIDMNRDELDYMDAIYLSPHKFVGGPGTPGVLVAKRALFANRTPVVPGGGTVTFVSSAVEDFVENPEHREEGGTPAIIESIRCGIVFKLKQAVGPERIEELESAFVQRAIARWQDNPNIWVLGNPDAPRLSIVSMQFRHGDRLLHWNYVVALLNDLFGIQARGGCSCAGPYAHELIDIDAEQSARIEQVLLDGVEALRPGWVRVNFNYFISEEAFTYIVEAIDLVGEHGWRLLPLYEVDIATGRWRHRDGYPAPAACLSRLGFDSATGEVRYASDFRHAPESVLTEQLAAARRVFAQAEGTTDPVQHTTFADADQERLRFFPSPEEVRQQLSGQQAPTP